LTIAGADPGAGGGGGYEDVTDNGIPVYSGEDYTNDAVNGYATLRWLNGTTGVMGSVFYAFSDTNDAHSLFIDSHGNVCVVRYGATGFVVKRISAAGVLVSTSADTAYSGTYSQTDYHPDTDQILFPSTGTGASASIKAASLNGTISTYTISLAGYGSGFSIRCVRALPRSRVLFMAISTGSNPVLVGMYDLAAASLLWLRVFPQAGYAQTSPTFLQDEEPSKLMISDTAAAIFCGSANEAAVRRNAWALSLATGATNSTNFGFGPGCYFIDITQGGTTLDGGNSCVILEQFTTVSPWLYVLSSAGAVVTSLDLETAYSIGGTGQIQDLCADETKIYFADWLATPAAIYCLNYSLVEQWKVTNYLTAQSKDIHQCVLPRYPNAMFQQVSFPKILNAMGG